MGEIKIFAYIILIALVFSIITTPFVEIFNVGRERILLGTTINNSCRAAKEASYDYINMRRIDAVEEETVFKESFADTFATSYGMTCVDTTASTLVFTGSEIYEDFYVDMDFKPEDVSEEYISTKVEITARSQYKFKTGYLQRISENDGIPFQLTSTRTFTMQVVN